MIKITLKHRDYNKVDSGVNWLFKALYNPFGEHVLGPTAPAVSRIRNQYIKNIVIKIPPKQNLVSTKNQLSKIKNTFEAVQQMSENNVSCLVVVDENNREAARHYISRGSVVKVDNDAMVQRGDLLSAPETSSHVVIAEWDPYSEPIIAEQKGNSETG